jgi:hypothetical protein
MKDMPPTTIPAPPLFPWGVQKLFHLVKDPDILKKTIDGVTSERKI